MKEHEPMNWTKKQTQQYGIFMSILGFLMGISITMLIVTLIQ